VHERGGLKGVARSLVAHVMAGEVVEFIVDEGKKGFFRALLSGADLREQPGYVAAALQSSPSISGTCPGS
jgi:hypothetical protein